MQSPFPRPLPPLPRPDIALSTNEISVGEEGEGGEDDHICYQDLASITRGQLFDKGLDYINLK